MKRVAANATLFLLVFLMLAFLAPFQSLLLKLALALALVGGAFGFGYLEGSASQREAIQAAQLKATEQAIVEANKASLDKLSMQIAAQAKRDQTAALFRELGSKVDKAIAKNPKYSDPGCGLTGEDLALWNQLNAGKKEEKSK